MEEAVSTFNGYLSEVLWRFHNALIHRGMNTEIKTKLLHCLDKMKQIIQDLPEKPK